MTIVTFEASSVVKATLSNGDLTATCTTSTTSAPTDSTCGAQGAAADAMSTGKLYFEVSFNVPDTSSPSNSVTQAIGVAPYGTPYSDIADYFTLGFGGVGYYSNAIVMGYNGNIYDCLFVAPGFTDFRPPTPSGNTPAANDVIGIAVDIDNALVWMKNITQAGSWNGSGTADPGTSTGGLPINSGMTLVPWTSFDLHNLQNSIQMAAPFTGTIPSGFSAWGTSGGGGGGQTGTLATSEGPDVVAITGDMPIPPIVFDPATAVDVTLSDGNLTGTQTSTSDTSGAKCTVGSIRANGKRYFEATFVNVSPTDTHQMIGIGSYTDTTDDYSAVQLQPLSLFADTQGHIHAADPLANTTYIGVGPGERVPNGIVLAVAVDLDLGHMWIRQCSEGGGGSWNGISGNPQFDINYFSIAPGSPLVPYMLFGGGSGDVGSPAAETTFNFTGPFAYFDTPSGTTGGFVPWDNEIPSTGTLASVEGPDHVALVGTSTGIILNNDRRVLVVT